MEGVGRGVGMLLRQAANMQLPWRTLIRTAPVQTDSLQRTENGTTWQDSKPDKMNWVNQGTGPPTAVQRVQQPHSNQPL